MNNENWVDIIKFITLVVATVTAIWKGFDYLSNRDKEKSVGITAVEELKTQFRTIQSDLSNLKKSDGDQSGQIERIEEDLRQLYFRIMDYYRK